jgi:hypothetical protein
VVAAGSSSADQSQIAVPSPLAHTRASKTVNQDQETPGPKRSLHEKAVAA